jgi:hypothetical protein
VADETAFATTFATLRGILTPFGAKMLVTVDTPSDFQLCDRVRTDRIGRPLFVAAVQIKKNYVSYHFMPIYAVPGLTKGLSASLKKRQQGKSCFNFTTIDPQHVRELTALTKTGIERLKNVPLPWDR